MSREKDKRAETEEELAKRLEERAEQEAPRPKRIEGDDGSEDELFNDLPV